MPSPCLNTGRKSAGRPALKFTLVPGNVDGRPPDGPDDSRRVRPEPIGGGDKYRERRVTMDRRGSVCFITDPLLGRRISRQTRRTPDRLVRYRGTGSTHETLLRTFASLPYRGRTRRRTRTLFRRACSTRTR